jgi:hypothetical protein
MYFHSSGGRESKVKTQAGLGAGLAASPREMSAVSSGGGQEGLAKVAEGSVKSSISVIAPFIHLNQMLLMGDTASS